MSNPEQRVLDDIDALIAEQLAAGEPGDDWGDEEGPECPHHGCDESWHGLPYGPCLGSATQGPQLSYELAFDLEQMNRLEQLYLERLPMIDSYLQEDRYRTEVMRRSVAQGFYFGPIGFIACFFAGEDFPRVDDSPWAIVPFGPYAKNNAWARWFWNGDDALVTAAPPKYKINISVDLEAMNAAAENDGTAMGYTIRTAGDEFVERPPVVFPAEGLVMKFGYPDPEENFEYHYNDDRRAWSTPNTEDNE